MINMLNLIEKKKHGSTLSTEEWNFFVDAYVDERIPDYQAAALLMAIWCKGLTNQETVDLTMAMVNSGDILDLSPIPGIKVDKHSTGGVGDKISLIVLPLAAAAGVPIAKLSGRGLGHTGGTIDKLEAIPGFRTDLSTATFIKQVQTIGVAIAGQTDRLTPADKKLYALRDVTATVDSLPLIAASIMSKKIASGADAIVLDVKMGDGAFMKDLDSARQLAHTMVALGNSMGRQTRAVITDMNQPLGAEIGNANEVREAIAVLKGAGSADETDIALEIAAHMTVLGQIYPDTQSAKEKLKLLIQQGLALEKLAALIQAQGGDANVIDNPALLPYPRNILPIKATQSGYIKSLKAETIGRAAMLAGAGRLTKNDVIDPAAGITLQVKTGDYVKAGTVLGFIGSNQSDLSAAQNLAIQAFEITPEPVKLPASPILDLIK